MLFIISSALPHTKPNFLFQLLIITRCEMTMVCTGEAAYYHATKIISFEAHQCWEVKHHPNLPFKAPVRAVYYVCVEFHCEY